MEADDEQYAAVEGVIVWEGPVDSLKARKAGEEGDQPDETGVMEEEEGDEVGMKGGRVIVRGEEGWNVIYKGQVPVGKSGAL